MNKFDTLYNSVMKGLGIIKEDTEFHKTRFDNSRYEFKKDENGNVLCTFSIFRDSNKFIVISKYFDEKLTFSVIDEKGNTKQLSEKEFAATYYKDYDDFKEAFDQYLKGEKNEDGTLADKTNINQFGDVLKKVMEKEGADEEKTYIIDDMTFIFRLLKDQLISNYCECIFQIQDDVTGEVIYYKALIAIKEKNSVIVKIITFDEKGNMKEPVMPSELEKNYSDVYKKLFKAIRKMGKYLADKDDKF